MAPLVEVANRNLSGPVYLPTASYAEMLHWALPASAYVEFDRFQEFVKNGYDWNRAERFVRGGLWKGFQHKYPEANFLAKRMQMTSDDLSAAESSGRVPSDKLAEARDALYAAQCNCPYWHGVFGGLYLPHLRTAVWSKLATAMDILDPARESCEIIASDYDFDGHAEFVVKTPHLFATIAPDHGGSLRELFDRRGRFLLNDTLTRRHEGYHDQLARAVVGSHDSLSSGASSIHDLVLAKEEGLRDLLVEDWYIRRSMIDHFLADDLTVEKFASGQFHDQGDFTLGAYAVESHTDSLITMSRRGMVNTDGRAHEVEVSKVYEFLPKCAGCEVSYEVRNVSSHFLRTNFAVENCFSFQAGHADDRYALINGAKARTPYHDTLGSHEDVESVGLVDEWRGSYVGIHYGDNVRLWRVPIFTVSLSEGGFEKVYQGVALVSCRSLALEPGESWKLRILILVGQSGEAVQALKPVRPTIKSLASR